MFAPVLKVGTDSAVQQLRDRYFNRIHKMSPFELTLNQQTVRVRRTAEVIDFLQNGFDPVRQANAVAS